MTRKLNFIWIDDSRQRRSSAKALSRNLKVGVDFVSVEKKNIWDEVENIVQGNKPDLILLDHRLNKIANSPIKTGATIAEWLHEELPDCPIVGVTAVDIVRDIDCGQRGIYEDIFGFQDLSKHYVSLKAIAESFRHMASNRPKSPDGLLALVKAPDSEKERLLTILPMHLRANFGDRSLLQRISKWLRQVLFKTPGFLYDELWTATLLGIKKSSFKKVSNMFREAKYRGVFADSSIPRWWPAVAKEILYKKFKDEAYMQPWELGQMLDKVSHADRSICYACSEHFPETVAFIDESSSKQEPMHLRCTIKHPKFQQMLFFEEIRVMEGAEE